MNNLKEKITKESATFICSAIVFLPLSLYGFIISNYIILACCLSGILFLSIPFFVHKFLHLQLSWGVLAIIIVHVLNCFIVGEIGGLYNSNSWWDKFLHGFAGIFFTYLAFCLVDLIIRNTDIKNKFAFALVGAITISLAITAVWEIIEFIVDSMFGTNMQKFIPKKSNVGTRFGLMDTMLDMVIHFCGMIVFSVFAIFAKNTKFIRNGITRIEVIETTSTTNDVALDDEATQTA